MKVFLTGATGFVGSHAARALLDAGHEVLALVRPGAEARLSGDLRASPGFHILTGDLLDERLTRRLDFECDAAVHLVGIIREHPRRGQTFKRCHVDATRAALEVAALHGAKRFIHTSALGAREGAYSEYHRSKYDAEFAVRAQRLPWIILRPSLVWGPGDHFINEQKRFVQAFVPYPMPGRGKNLVQPVAVANLAEGIVRTLDPDVKTGRILEVGGPERIALNRIINLIAEAKGISPRKMHLPPGLMRLALGLAESLPLMPTLPIATDYLRMMSEDNVCDSRAFFDEFEIKPVTLTAEALREYI